MNPAEVHYKVPWRARSYLPGHHASQQQGGGSEFRHHRALIDAPDPRRFDVRASLRDPFGQIQVRIYQQTSSIPVWVIADLSASMGFRGVASKMTTMAEFVAGLSFSAWRTGDRFGFVGCENAGQRPSWVLPAGMNRAAGLETAAQLENWQPSADSAGELLGAAEVLGTRRALVFLLSDFHLPDAQLDSVMASLAYHDVVPVVLWDRYEYEDLPRFGLARVVDPETRRNRLLVMRPGLKRRIEESFRERARELFTRFSAHDRAPLFLASGFDADRVTQYFYG